MGSLTACWKLCFNMPGWVWKKISFLISINPALTHGSEVAPENAAHPSGDAKRCCLFTHPAVAGQQFNSFGGKSQ